MNRWLTAAILSLSVAAAPAASASSPVLRIGVLPFRAAGIGMSGVAVSDLFSAALYRNFPGLSVANQAELEAAASREHLDALVGGSVIALNLDAGGNGGTLMMSANLVKLASGEILWADTRTARIKAPLLARLWRKTPKPERDSGSVMTAKLLQLAVFQLVQDLGARLPEEALSPAGGRAAAGRKDSGSEACVPPVFYESLPRDRDWYYGAGKSPDTGLAREAAVRNLIKQASSEELAAGGVPLAGWEQDDYRRCAGFSYVLVRIKQEQAQKSINDSAILSAARPATLSDKVPSGRALDEIARANSARTAMIYSDLFGPEKSCGAGGCGAPAPEEIRFIAAARRKLAADSITVEDVVRVSNIYLRRSEAAEEREFFNAVLYRKRPLPGPLTENFELTRELVFPLAWSAALRRKDWLGYFKYCGNYLRSYPDGLYAATAERNRENAARILMRRNADIAAITQPSND
jgi:hypothetical protein